MIEAGRIERAAAALVRQQHRRPLRRDVVTVAPTQQHQQHRIIFHALARDPIFVAGRGGGIGALANHTDRFQPLEPFRQDVGGDRGVGQPTAKVAIKGASTYDSALDISNVTMPKKAGIQLRYNSYSNASNTYKHINVEEAAGTSVLLLDNNRFMVNKPVQLNTPTAKNISLYIGGTDAVRIPSGKTSERPAADDTEVGMMRYNTDNSRYEVYQGAAWQEIQAGRTSANMLELGTTWKPLASVDAEGHTHSFTIPAGADTSKGGFGATSWPFVQFQTKVAAGKFRSCTYDYEVSIPGYNIIVYATFASDAEAAAEDVRYFVSW